MDDLLAVKVLDALEKLLDNPEFLGWGELGEHQLVLEFHRHLEVLKDNVEIVLVLKALADSNDGGMADDGIYFNFVFHVPVLPFRSLLDDFDCLADQQAEKRSEKS